MIPLGTIASSRVETIVPPDEPGYDPITLLGIYSANSSPQVRPVMTGVDTTPGCAIIVAASIKDTGPTLYSAGDSAGNTYELIGLYAPSTHSAATAIFIAYDTEPMSKGSIYVDALYDDPANGYPFANGVSRIWALYLNNVGPLAGPVTHLFTPFTPIKPSEVFAEPGDLIFGVLTGAVTNRVWTPSNPDFTYPEAYRGGSLTSQLVLRIPNTAGLSSPSWDRSGSDSNSVVLLAHFKPRPT